MKKFLNGSIRLACNVVLVSVVLGASSGCLLADDDTSPDPATKPPAFILVGLNATRPSGSLQGTYVHPSVQFPLTASDKFNYFVHHGLIGPDAILYPAAGAVVKQLIDPWGGRTGGDKAADTLSRWATTYATSASRHFFSDFAFATILKQDPRYKPSARSGFRARSVHAVTRVIITEGDNGTEQFNYSRVGGNLAASGLTNFWARNGDVGVSDTFRRFGISLGFDALRFMWKEFSPDIKRKFLGR